MTQSFIMIIALIMLGYILKKLKYLKEEDGRVLATLVMNVTLRFPCDCDFKRGRN